MAPPYSCEGGPDDESVQRLVIGGGAVALVDVVIDAERPEPFNDISGTVPVKDVALVAGTLPSGPLQAVLEDTQGGTDILTPGHYLVLLSDFHLRADTYLLSRGYEGTFLLAGDKAIQRCWDFGRAQLTTAARSVPADELAARFRAAFSAHPSPVPATN